MIDSRSAQRGRLHPPSRAVRALALLVLTAAVGCSTRSHSPGEAPLAYRQAEDSFRMGNYERAARGYQIFLESQFSDDYEDLVPRAFYRLALSEYRRGRYQECLAALDQMDKRLPGREWPQVYSLRGDAEQARGHSMRALRWWAQAWEASEGEEKQAAKQHVADALARMDASSLRTARTVLTEPALRALVDERLGTPAREPRVASVPREDQRRRDTSRRSAPPPKRSDEEQSEEEEPIEGPVRIGALLPLSGEYASYGQRSLNGIKLALGPLADQLVVRDTRGDIATARAALDELIADRSVIAVIGPLRSKVAEVIAPRAESAGMPLVMLSQQDGSTGQWVKQPAMTSARQAAELAQYAVGKHGMRRFAVFYPNDPYGISLSSAFRAEVERRGATVIGAIVYDPRQREFSVERLSLDKWVSDDGLQAVFIPDFAENAIPLASRLRQGHPEIALFGSNGWNDPGVLGTAAAELDGAVFVDGFFPSSTRRATGEFVGAYRHAYGATPDILEAQAYDAALLVARAFQGNARSRLQVAQALQAPATVQGASGELTIGPQGIQRQLFLLRLNKGTISEIVLDGQRPEPLRAAAQDPETDLPAAP